ncbi:RES domain-containing protein [uncultured Sphingomonas sp.]|uniref:RES domain-containing protein n=1 Tax=uncultured Sphingomonas sp. TaxID=158754 RepID=UPI0025EE4C07|nr:RES domain-containing protein [uncultured Sphingomonas sp.]
MNVCPECFENTALKRRLVEIRPGLPDNERCEIHPTRKAIPLDEVGKIVEPALRNNYTIGEWMFDHQEGDDLYDVINGTTGADDDRVINGLIRWLVDNDHYWPPDGEEAFFAEDQTYVPIRLDGWRHGALWRRFRDAILHRQRFFNDNAKEFLAEIFNGIQNQSDIDNKPAFYRLAPGDETTFYRARVVPNEDAFREIAKDPAGLMGPPPPSLRKAGRMNAAGIAVFYGATEKDTAVAEMRPAVGSLISLAAFRVHRPIHVLDLTRFTRAGKQLDIFAKNQMVRATQWAFMQSFASEISQPILPSDEHLEYVPAQVVAEYLTSTSVRWRGSDVTPDAIIFRSAQREGGKNIAVMGDATLIHHPAPPDSLGDVKANHQADDFDFLDFASPLPAASNAGIEYIEDSIELLQVGSAKYAIDTHYASPVTVRDLPDLGEQDF